MKFSFFSVQNYRSITDGYKLDLSNLTVLLGKNNTGKTNIIRAINLGMEILSNMKLYYRRKVLPKSLYNWSDDFPISLQSTKRMKNENKKTKLRMDFFLDQSETDQFFSAVHSSINGNLSVYIEIDQDNSLKVTLPKKGKNASAMTMKIVEISEFICKRFGVQYIPAVRSEIDAYQAIRGLVDDELASIDDENYQNALKLISDYQSDCLTRLSQKVSAPLKTFLPAIKKIDIYREYESRFRNAARNRSVAIDIDDGVKTSLSNKGDGVKSLVTIAILSQISTQGQRLIIVDEPENHLHPEAIHYIDNVLKELSINHQVLISTHSPIFVNRSVISYNLIVDEGKVAPAENVESIRETLGVSCSDNLMDANYIIVVEGASDKEVIEKFIMDDSELSTLLINKEIVVLDMGGTHNVMYVVNSLRMMCCDFAIILDYDPAGKEARNELHRLSVPDENIRFFMKPGKKPTELEDLYDTQIYTAFFLDKGIDISTGPASSILKNQSWQWSNRISKIYELYGQELDKSLECEIKKDISHNLVKTPLKECFTNDGYTNIINILSFIKEQITKKHRN